MKTVYEILNKKYDRKLINQKEMKPQWKKMCEHASECFIQVRGKEDYDFFQMEIIENSLQVKSKFEEVFLDMYVTMHDYWYDLTYQERKKQMNLEIQKLKEQLDCFQEGTQEIYMPCFDPKFNHLYTDEIVLLDLKQYHTFIRSFASQIQYDYYGMLPFLHGFSSAQVLAYDENKFVLYHKLSNRFYVYQDKKFLKQLSLHPNKVTDDTKIIDDLASCLIQDDESGIVELLKDSELISKHMRKKIVKYHLKKERKIKKQQAKEAKKMKQE